MYVFVFLVSCFLLSCHSISHSLIIIQGLYVHNIGNLSYNNNNFRVNFTLFIVYFFSYFWQMMTL